MQTFLPYPDFRESAACLDRQRLGKQRVEAWQILRALTGYPSRWRNHPATKMWDGHVDALCAYGRAVCDEWIGRGYRDSMRERFGDCDGPVPSWVGDPMFHAAHRSSLLRKDSTWYRRFGWTEAPDLPYVWPVQ